MDFFTTKPALVLAACIFTVGAAGMAQAKLPAPSPEAKAKAAEATAKSAYGDKVAAYKLCLTQDRVAAAYLKNKPKSAPATAPVAPVPATPIPTPAADAVTPAAGGGTAVPGSAATPVASASGVAPVAASASIPSAAPAIPSCQDPGPYVSAQEAAKVGVADALPLNKEPVKK